ncbi:hypothetical protein SJI45_22180 [Streptomyces sp. S399]|uniref:hypothetical protein n=1 Tax=Streptomyces TaxID=1883 RepID=UPI002A8368DA|nr:hypothetical protein [Streptomyces sp. S399]WPR53353.1 hypothetical protein SJI45_22180 [Streptomyces sp. S399]
MAGPTTNGPGAGPGPYPPGGDPYGPYAPYGRGSPYGPPGGGHHGYPGHGFPAQVPYAPPGPADAPLVVPSRGGFLRTWLGWLLPPVAARRLCRPSRPDRVDDPATRVVQRMRAFAGFVVVLGVALVYQVADAVEAVTAPWVQLVQNCVVLVLVVPVTLAVFVKAARPGMRRIYLRRARGPLCVLLSLLVSLVAVLAVAFTQPGGDVTGSGLWLVLAMAWLVFFGLGALANSVANVFRTADVHEVVPPLVSVALVWVNLVVDLVTGKYGDAPEKVAAFLLWGGPLTVTCLALWELRRLRVHHGLTLRRALGR